MRRLLFAMILFFAPIALFADGFRAVVIPVEFSDLSFTDRQTAVDTKVQVASKYFNDQFSPGRTFTFDVLPTVHLKKLYSWYGANSSTSRDFRCGELVRDVISAISANLSPYDNDGDGVVDNVYLLAAGPSESDGAGADYLWPKQARMSESGGRIQYGNSFIDSFTVCTEFSSPAVFCHEFAHTFGLPDLYDTDGSGSSGTAKGLWGKLSLMGMGEDEAASGLPVNFSAIELEQLGIGNRVPFYRGYCRLFPISSSKQYLRIDSGIEGEYYLLECRKPEGWDQSLSGGLIIYHIDKSNNNAWFSDLYKRNLTARERWQLNQVNCRPDHQCAYVVSATPGTTDVKYAFFPQPGHSTFGSDTDPSFRFWNGETSIFAIDQISVGSDGSINLFILTPITLRSSQTFQDAIILSWETDSRLDISHCLVSWHNEDAKEGTVLESAQVQPQPDGTFFYVVEGLKPSSSYSIRIQAILKDASSFSYQLSLDTKGMQKDTYPFIYLNSGSRNEDGSFKSGEPVPLRVYNLEDSPMVTWYFDGSIIKPDSDGYWHPVSSGTLKAEIWYQDGSMEIITKRINVR